MTKTIFHGSENIVVPEYGKGKRFNDYGPGFYCTAELELAKEWACSHGEDGYANAYELKLDGLSILNLNDAKFSILNWIAILLENRRFPTPSPIVQTAKEYLLANFLPNYTEYDIIKGYRADDSYFSYAGDFIRNSLSLKDLKEAMELGKLGEQIVLKSEKAFNNIKPLEVIPAYAEEYYIKYVARDTEARRKYTEISNHPFSPNEIYILDIIRGEMKNGDSRLR